MALASLPGGVNDGEQLWRKLVSQHANIRLVVCGHALGDGVGLLTSEGKGGQRVHQLLVNFQANEEGGWGYLRLLEFSPDGTVQARTYSPFLDRWKTDRQNQFRLELPGPAKDKRSR